MFDIVNGFFKSMPKMAVDQSVLCRFVDRLIC
jgi:hypothetical protein